MTPPRAASSTQRAALSPPPRTPRALGNSRCMISAAPAQAYAAPPCRAPPCRAPPATMRHCAEHTTAGVERTAAYAPPHASWADATGRNGHALSNDLAKLVVLGNALHEDAHGGARLPGGSLACAWRAPALHRGRGCPKPWHFPRSRAGTAGFSCLPTAAVNTPCDTLKLGIRTRFGYHVFSKIFSSLLWPEPKRFMGKV